MSFVYVDGEYYPVQEDASMIKKKKRKKRPDPKRSRAAKKAAKDPKTKAARKKGSRKFHKSAKGKAFHKKLGRFNAKRSTLKSSQNLPMALQTLREFLAADPPEEYRDRAQGVLDACSEGIVDVRRVIEKINELAEDVDRDFDEADVEEARTFADPTSLFMGDAIGLLQRWARSYGLSRIYQSHEGGLSFDIGGGSASISAEPHGRNQVVIDDVSMAGEARIEVWDQLEKLEGNTYRKPEGLVDDITQLLSKAEDIIKDKYPEDDEEW